MGAASQLPKLCTGADKPATPSKEVMDASPIIYASPIISMFNSFGFQMSPHQQDASDASSIPVRLQTHSDKLPGL